ncbi:hypothetical protein RQP46_009452 [Phenoliferia psychrophenolica]
MGFLLFGYDQGVMGGLLTLPSFVDTFPRIDTINTTGELKCTAFSLGQLIAGRIVTGVGNGFITATVPTWQSECAKWIDFGFYFTAGSTSWRVSIALQVIFAIFIMVFVLPLPESPRWLIKKGRIEEAAVVFAALDDVEVDDPQIAVQIDEIRATLSLVESGGLRDIFGPQDKERMGQQITGINLITYYAGTEYFIASFIAVYTIEKLGRRKLMLFGAVGQAGTMALLAVTTYLAAKTDALPHPGKDNAAAGIVAAILLFVFNTFFAIGWLGMTWLYPSEINSLRVRTPATGISTAGNWIFNFLVVLVTPIAFDTIGYYTYAVFAVINAIMVPAVYFFLPETAGRSLEEIDDIFEKADPKRPWSVVKVADELPFRATFDSKMDPEAAYALRQRFGKKDSIEKPEHIE